MKLYLCALSVIALSACSSGGGGVDLTPSAPSVSSNQTVGQAMNAVRVGSNLLYNQSVGQAAQLQANDMYTYNYNTEIDPNDPTDGDVGDRLVAQNYQWDNYEALLDQGDRSLGQQISIFNAETCTGSQLCINDPGLEDFGFAKAGSGADTRWVLILGDPSN